ncbi:hypothetical protein [Anianabacter salinae]|uniref:hypothetical protein n=1 Tax=Anianabacter salinae TaxID=2851023 RepID=UPI00225DDEBF|nr:hypothetical protein [Anianabacter salinae]MBV0912197.1 hypothetical protein [Anianabacter salinae]
MSARWLAAALLAWAALSPGAALAFCGGWDSPVAMGFDHGSWGEKWPVLAGILLFVLVFSSLIIRQIRTMRDPAFDEA